jgi:hypothetical protein
MPEALPLVRVQGAKLLGGFQSLPPDVDPGGRALILPDPGEYSA